MTAKEAKQISLESKSIIDKINEAAFKGLTTITIYNSISKTVYDGLQKLGYNIKSNSGGYNETYYIISW